MTKHYHLIGIGGIGMSGIAQLLIRRGIKVSGSDVKTSKATEELQKLGAKISIGHNAKNIECPDIVVYSSAIKGDNPEIMQSKKQGIPIIKRAQALAELMQEKKVITIAGSHGKTTTSSLVSYLLMQAGLNPTIAVGGIFKNIENNAYFGEGDYFVAEADESDGSFLYFQPDYSIITNIDYEHMDYYQNFNNEVKAFEEFIQKTKPGGCLFCCANDQALRKITSTYQNRHILFGLDNADIYPKDIKFKGLNSEFECLYKGESLGIFKLALGGRHNVSNALSVIALGLEIGIDIKIIKDTLSGYKGAGRRLEIKYKNNDYLVIDDYAHHPTEIRATLDAARNLDKARLKVIFQPHRFSRTKLLLEEFGKCFALADQLIITDIYPASELPIAGINSQLVCDEVRKNNPDKNIIYLPKADIPGYILKNIKSGDLIITLGAGDITRICDNLVEEMKSKYEGSK